MKSASTKWFSVWLATVLGVAAAYWVAGRLALLLPIPPGYASPVWPAVAALALEERGRTENLAGAGSACQELGRQLDRLMPVLTGFAPERLTEQGAEG